MTHAHIELTGPGLGKIFIDGVELKNVLSFKLEVEAQKINVLTVSLHADSVHVSAPVDLKKVNKSI